MDGRDGRRRDIIELYEGLVDLILVATVDGVMTILLSVYDNFASK